MHAFRSVVMAALVAVWVMGARPAQADEGTLTDPFGDAHCYNQSSNGFTDTPCPAGVDATAASLRYQDGVIDLSLTAPDGVDPSQWAAGTYVKWNIRGRPSPDGSAYYVLYGANGASAGTNGHAADGIVTCTGLAASFDPAQSIYRVSVPDTCLGTGSVASFMAEFASYPTGCPCANDQVTAANDLYSDPVAETRTPAPSTTTTTTGSSSTSSTSSTAGSSGSSTSAGQPSATTARPAKSNASTASTAAVDAAPSTSNDSASTTTLADPTATSSPQSQGQQLADGRRLHRGSGSAWLVALLLVAILVAAIGAGFAWRRRPHAPPGPS
jgi:hypothetical protein